MIKVQDIRPVLGSPRYYVSSIGQVYKNRSTRSVMLLRKLRTRPDRTGYIVASVSVLGANKYRKVHRLVLEAFVGAAPEGMQADHIDGVRSNNSITNLRWVTRAENMRAMYERRGGAPWQRGEGHHRAKLTWAKVRAIRAKVATGLYLQKQIAVEFGVTRATIMNITRNLQWIE